MELTPELLGTAAVGVVIILGAVGNYLRSLKALPSQPDAVLRGIGMELGDKDQTERLIAQVKRIADGMDILADKRTDEMEEIHKTLLARLDMQERREEQEEQQPRRPTPRRR
jgi:hypothetical protein